jgi:hypothetical protein
MTNQASMSDHANVGAHASAPARRRDSRRRMRTAGARGFPWIVSARRGGLLAAAVLALTGLLFAWQASMIDLGHVGLPGPGFFPMLLGVLLVAFAIASGIEDWNAAAKGAPVELGHSHVLIVVVALLAVPLLFDLLGAYVTLGLLSVALLMFVARLSPLLAIVWTIVGLAACWYLFQELLGLRLPMGAF